MRRAPAIAAALIVLAAPARGSQGAGAVLAPGSGSEWKPLLETLAARSVVVAPFTERRYFPFRREPLVLHGVLRISKERGLSLEYTDPVPSIVIADPGGLLLRDRDGRSRALAAGSRESGSLDSLLAIMRFDLGPLYPRFTITALREGQAWTLAFAPRDPALADSVGEIVVRGSGSDVRGLEFRRSASQRVEIEVGAARTGVSFSPEELGRFFR